MQSVPEGALIVAVFGAMLWTVGFICFLGSIAHRNPDVSLWEIYWRASCWCPRRQDYTPAGWGLHWAAWIMTLVGFAMLATAGWMSTP